MRLSLGEIAGPDTEPSGGEMRRGVAGALPDPPHRLLLLPDARLHPTDRAGEQPRLGRTAQRRGHCRQAVVGRRLVRIQVEGAQKLVPRLLSPTEALEQQSELEAGGGILRDGKPVYEDATFGYRAAAPALLCNDSYRQRREIDWDPVAMKIVS